MENPSLPHRRIKHADLLVRAGFEIDMEFYKRRSGMPGTKLIYWKRDNIRVTLFDYRNISLEKLIALIECSITYNLKTKARVIFD